MRPDRATPSPAVAPPPGVSSRFKFIDWMERLEAFMGLAVLFLLLCFLLMASIGITATLFSDAQTLAGYLVAGAAGLGLFAMLFLQLRTARICSAYF